MKYQDKSTSDLNFQNHFIIYICVSHNNLYNIMFKYNNIYNCMYIGNTYICVYISTGRIPPNLMFVCICNTNMVCMYIVLFQFISIILKRLKKHVLIYIFFNIIIFNVFL